MKSLHGCVSVFLITVCLGCAETAFIQSPGRLIPKAWKSAHRTHPARVLCLWEAAEGQGIDGRPCRGFAGQILFFTAGKPSPVPVHGTVRIHEYDDFDPDVLDPKPVHVFIFDDGGWNAHRGESTVGESYNVFIPYVKNHGQLANCGLKVEFIAEDGRTLSSAVTEIALEPRQRRSDVQPAIRRNVLQKKDSPLNGQLDASGTSPAPAAGSSAVPGSPPLDSLTIPLPRGHR